MRANDLFCLFGMSHHFVLEVTGTGWLWMQRLTVRTRIEACDGIYTEGWQGASGA